MFEQIMIVAIVVLTAYLVVCSVIASSLLLSLCFETHRHAIAKLKGKEQ